MEILVSERARRYIAARGGDVYIYFDPVGQSDWMMQRVKLRRPPGREVDLYECDGLRIWLDAGFGPPPRLEIRRMFWRFGPLQVTGTGAGEAVGASGDGGSWPTYGHGGGSDGGGGHGGHVGH